VGCGARAVSGDIRIATQWRPEAEVLMLGDLLGNGGCRSTRSVNRHAD